MRALRWVGLAMCLAMPVRAETPAPEPAPDWSLFHGAWIGQGQVRGMDANVNLEFREAIGGRGHHLRFENAMRTPEGGEWRFQAEAVYLCETPGVCRGHWYDSRGEILPVLATVAPGQLVVEWGGEGSERGRTTYARSGESLHITDEVLDKDGAWKIFGRVRAERASP